MYCPSTIWKSISYCFIFSYFSAWWIIRSLYLSYLQGACLVRTCSICMYLVGWLVLVEAGICLFATCQKYLEWSDDKRKDTRDGIKFKNAFVRKGNSWRSYWITRWFLRRISNGKTIYFNSFNFQLYQRIVCFFFMSFKSSTILQEIWKA